MEMFHSCVIFVPKLVKLLNSVLQLMIGIEIYIQIEELCKSLSQNDGKESACENIITLSMGTSKIPKSHPERCFMDLWEE